MYIKKLCIEKNTMHKLQNLQGFFVGVFVFNTLFFHLELKIPLKHSDKFCVYVYIFVW